MPELIDQQGRRINNLRVSVTDRCNLRCIYCMPAEGVPWMPRSEILSYEEITRLVRVFAGLGITKVRLTGGEPLLRSDLPQLVEQLAAIEGVCDLAMTTNGYFLTKMAADLQRAGLHRLNISLDSLDPARFAALVRRDAFARTMEGIQTALGLPFRSIKINVVVIRGFNDDEVVAFAEFARTPGVQVRFIEFMPIGAEDGWARDKVVPGREIRETIEARYGLEPVHTDPEHPASVYVLPDGGGQIGFIDSVSNPFCGSCNRIRITADGMLRTCLFSMTETDLKAPLREGCSDAALAEIIRGAVWLKEPGHLINDDAFERPTRTMSQIGG